MEAVEWKRGLYNLTDYFKSSKKRENKYRH